MYPAANCKPIGIKYNDLVRLSSYAVQNLLAIKNEYAKSATVSHCLETEKLQIKQTCVTEWFGSHWRLHISQRVVALAHEEHLLSAVAVSGHFPGLPSSHDVARA